MTTFLLHGGVTSRSSLQNQHFFEQFTQLVNKNEVIILLCYFSRPKDRWDELIARDSKRIKQASNKAVTFLIAQSPSDLLEKMDQADVLYVAGGDAEPIEATYPALVNLSQKLKGKVYAGSSMGAFLAGEQYVLSMDSQDSATPHQGLGLLPIQILCHWNVEPEKDRKLFLLTKSSNKPILVLNEEEVVTLYGN